MNVLCEGDEMEKESGTLSVFFVVKNFFGFSKKHVDSKSCI